MTKNIKNLMLSTGYVESQSLAVMLVSHEVGFPTVEEAIIDFSAALKEYVEQQEKYVRNYARNKECCKKTLAKLACSAFCATCGARLADEPIEHQDLVDAFDKMMCGTMDGFGDGWEIFSNRGWQVPSWSLDFSNMVAVTDFRPVVSGMLDEDARMVNNEISECGSSEEPRKFDYKNVPAGFVKAKNEWEDEEDEEEAEAYAGDEADEQRCDLDELAFCLTKSFDYPTWTACVTPEKYFIETGCCYDQHLLTKIPGWSDIMEGVYAPDDEKATVEALHAHLLSLGLKYNNALASFLTGLGQTVHVPSPNTAPIAPAPVNRLANFLIGRNTCIPPTIPAGNIDTDLCREILADMVKKNPGLIAAQFSDPKGNPVTPAESAQFDLDGSNPKNWIRKSKEKDGKHNLRLFDCKPMFDQLRAYVRDDGKAIVGILIIGE